MEIPTIDTISALENITTQVMEDHENFIFETILPYCEDVIQLKINKAELKRILLLGIQKDKELRDEVEEVQDENSD